MFTKILALLATSFLLIFTLKASNNMQTIPFHDFDEAHRAEQTKRMKEYLSFLVPLSGSPQDRTPDLRVPVRGNRNLFLYYHPERPPFVYWLMIISTSIFGQSEWAYRLPSFLMALATLVVFILFILLSKNLKIMPLFIGLISLITSVDLWLSGQYAQLDTSITFFLTLSLFSLIFYIENKKEVLLVISGVSLSLAILSKGQPAAIFLFPLIYLLATKKLGWKKLLKLSSYSAIILLPWIFLLNAYFGLGNIVKIFVGFSASSAITEYSFIKAPIFWYLRWWWDTFSPGFSLFLALLVFDILYRQLTWKKLTLLSYILGSLAFFSIFSNKIWWYVLPLVPAIAYYIYLSSSDYLTKRSGFTNLALAIAISSLTIFYGETNSMVISFGIITTGLSTVILLMRNLKFLDKTETHLMVAAIFLSLCFFYLHFPKIVPYHRNTKFVAQYFRDLPGRKCLWVKEMPPETALFYSNAGEITPLTEGGDLFPDCENYLITPEDTAQDNLTYTLQGEKAKVKDAPVIYQKGTMKLIKL